MRLPKGIPQPTEEFHISRVLPLFREMLEYCAREVLVNPVSGAELSYDSETDLVVYHLHVNSIDRELFTLLNGVEEIWILQKAGAES